MPGIVPGVTEREANRALVGGVQAVRRIESSLVAGQSEAPNAVVDGVGQSAVDEQEERAPLVDSRDH
jgi:hypothetical protein